MAIHLSADRLAQAQAWLRGIPGGVERALAPAINRAILAGKTFGVRKLAATYEAKRATVARSTFLQKATRATTAGAFLGRGPRLPLTSFKVRPLRRSKSNDRLTVTVRKDAGGTGIRRGFVNTIAGGRLAVLQREGADRYPLRALAGPAVPQMLNEEGVRGEVEARALEVLGSRFDHEVNRLLRGTL